MPELVLEKRRFPRVPLGMSGQLEYKDGGYPARLENISLGGALITFQESDYPFVSRGERCILSLYRSGGEVLRIPTRMVHLGFDMACVRFVNLNLNNRLLLRSIIAHQMPECSTPRTLSKCRV
jgi:hypothetical protein